MYNLTQGRCRRLPAVIFACALAFPPVVDALPAATAQPETAHSGNHVPNSTSPMTEGVGTRIVNSKDEWTANLYFFGVPAQHQLGEDFEYSFEIAQTTDADNPNIDNAVARGVFALATTSGVSISDVSTQCYDPAEDDENADGEAIPGNVVGCSIGEAQPGIDLMADGASYVGERLVPYVVPNYGSITVKVRGTYTEEGHQGVLVSAADYEDLDSAELLTHSLNNQALTQRTFVSEDGTATNPDIEVQRETKATVQVSQDKKTINSGSTRTYIIRLENSGNESISSGLLAGNYLFGTEDHRLVEGGSVAVTPSCTTPTLDDMQVKAVCPAWADGEEVTVDLDRGHDHGHDHIVGAAGLPRFGNVFDGPVELPAHSVLELALEVRPKLPHGLNKATDSFVAILSSPWEAGLAFTGDSVLEASQSGEVLNLAGSDHDHEGLDDGHDHGGKGDDHDHGGNGGGHDHGGKDGGHGHDGHGRDDHGGKDDDHGVHSPASNGRGHDHDHGHAHFGTKGKKLADTGVSGATGVVIAGLLLLTAGVGVVSYRKRRNV